MAIPAFLFALIHLLGAITAVRTPTDLVSREVSLSVSGLLLVWACLFAVAGVLLAQARSGALVASIGFSVIYGMVSIIRLYLYGRVEYDRMQIPFRIILTIGLIALMSIIYLTTKRRGPKNGE